MYVNFAINSKSPAPKYCNSHLMETSAIHIFLRTIRLTRSYTRELMTTTQLAGGTRHCRKNNKGGCGALCAVAMEARARSQANWSNKHGLHGPCWPSRLYRICSNWELRRE